MDKKRNYYLIVPIENIYNYSKETGKVSIDNKKIKHTFKEFGVPVNYQKLIFMISIGDTTEPDEVKELFTDKLFYFKTPFDKAVANPFNNAIIELVSNDIRVVTINEILTAETVDAFYQDITNNNMVNNYRNAILMAFGLDYKKQDDNAFTKRKKKF